MIDWFMYDDSPSVSDVREMLIRACVQEEGDPCVVSGLLTAYLALAEGTDDPPKDFVSGADAEAVFMTWFIKCHDHFADWRYDTTDCSHWWPDSMPYGEKKVYPKILLREIARVMASKCVSETKMRVAYYKSMKSDDSAEGVKSAS
jgi:hypothetical protein